MKAWEGSVAESTAKSTATPAEEERLSVKEKLVIAGTIVAALVLSAITLYAIVPSRVETINLAEQAKRFIRFRKHEPLSESLETILSDPELYIVPTQDHPLLNKVAPDFALKDPVGKVVRLSEINKKGPVVLVFYYGYWCDHCVAQLFSLEEDRKRFESLGAEIVAISPDSPELTRERFDEYGAFHFAVLSDPFLEVARSFGAVHPADHGEVEHSRHATFVIDRERKIRWADVGDQPFIHNQTLLAELARLDGRFPKATAPSK